MDAGVVGLIGIAVAALLVVTGVWARRRRAEMVRRTAERIERGPGTDPLVGDLAPVVEAADRVAARLAARIEEAERDREPLRGILAAMDEGVVLVTEGTVRYANPAVRRILGFEPRSVRGLAPSALRAVIEEAAGSGRPAEREIETGLPVRQLVAAATPLPAGAGILLVLRDVTAARRVEAMRRDFVAHASHELKTPAAAIQATAQTVERAIRDDPEAASRFARQLLREAERLARIVSDLLDLSRLETERPRFEAVRLDRLAREEASRMGEAARRAGVALEVHTEEVTVTGVPKDLALLVVNLVENAVRYTPEGGRVLVRVTRDEEGATLTVSDTGIGIPSRDLPRVFERFFRVDRARSRETGGTGLGLSIARHVAQQHGGRIEAQSELGRGSTFRVTLPTAEPSDHPGGR